MRFAFLACISILAVACNSSVTSGGEGGSSTSSTGTTGATSSGTGGDACKAPASPAPFEAGQGETCFGRLTPGQTVTVLQGPQGGYHIWFAVSCVGCDAKTTIEFGVKDPATMTWFKDTSPQKVSVDLGGAGWQQQAGFTAFLPGVPWDQTTSLPKGTHVLLTGIRYGADGKPVTEIQNDVVLGDIEQYSPPCDPNPMTCGTLGGLPCCALSG
jgi:hypothetical protein